MLTRFNILSLSGGGFLGLYTIALLAALEKEFGVPIARSFDLIAGTSIGGIIAIGLAAEIPAENILNAFESSGDRIFSDRPVPNGNIASIIDFFRSFFHPKYSPDELRKTVGTLIGEDTRFGSLKHRVIVPTVNITKGSPQIFKTPHHKSYRTDRNLLAMDIAMATSAAPTIFPIAEIEDQLFIDGGVYANSPDLLALHEACHFLGREESELYVLSIGTTTSRYSLAHATGLRPGVFHWFKQHDLMNVIISAQQQSTDFIMRHRLGSRYLRLDSDKSPDQRRGLALDVATSAARKTIKGLAAATFQSSVMRGDLQDFFKHRPVVPEFYGGE